MAPSSEIAAWFEPATPRSAVAEVFERSYWSVAFEMFFGDALLTAMFGSAATQHAVKGSYPDYFRRRLEAGLLAQDACSNYFLHHIFLGLYRPDALPVFLSEPINTSAFDLRPGVLTDIEDLREYDLIDLSNIMDWMPDRQAEAMIAALSREMRGGASVLWRQLNNHRDCRLWFGDDFSFDLATEAELTQSERSWFYESVCWGTKR